MSNELFMSQVIMFVLVILSLCFSFIAMLFNIKSYINQQATEKSTHIVEYVKDPMDLYDDLNLQKEIADGNVVVKKEKEESLEFNVDGEIEEDINSIEEMEEFLKDNEGVII